MRIITERRLLEFADQHPGARPNIQRLIELLRAAQWETFEALRRVLPHADQVRVRSGNVVTVLNLGRPYRLVTAIHYNRRMIYILRVMTHAEYDRGEWKIAL